MQSGDWAIKIQIQMQILNKPNCHKCEKPALTLISNMWLCGDCVMKLKEKMDKLKERILLEE